MCLTRVLDVKDYIISTIGTHEIVDYAMNKSLSFDLFAVRT